MFKSACFQLRDSWTHLEQGPNKISTTVLGREQVVGELVGEDVGSELVGEMVGDAA